MSLTCTKTCYGLSISLNELFQIDIRMVFDASCVRMAVMLCEPESMPSMMTKTAPMDNDDSDLGRLQSKVNEMIDKLFDQSNELNVTEDAIREAVFEKSDKYIEFLLDDNRLGDDECDLDD